MWRCFAGRRSRIHLRARASSGRIHGHNQGLREATARNEVCIAVDSEQVQQHLQQHGIFATTHGVQAIVHRQGNRAYRAIAGSGFAPGSGQSVHAKNALTSGFVSCECATLAHPISKATATNAMREILFISNARDCLYLTGPTWNTRTCAC